MLKPRTKVYWQYFCGYEYLQANLDVSEATIRRFRNALGEDGYNEILKELLRIGLKVGALKKKDLDSVIIDTTVQIKKSPHQKSWSSIFIRGREQKNYTKSIRKWYN